MQVCRSCHSVWCRIWAMEQTWSTCKEAKNYGHGWWATPTRHSDCLQPACKLTPCQGSQLRWARKHLVGEASQHLRLRSEASLASGTRCELKQHQEIANQVEYRQCALNEWGKEGEEIPSLPSNELTYQFRSGLDRDGLWNSDFALCLALTALNFRSSRPSTGRGQRPTLCRREPHLRHQCMRSL